MSNSFEIHDEGIIPASPEEFIKNGNRFLTLAEVEAKLTNSQAKKEVIKITFDVPETRK